MESCVYDILLYADIPIHVKLFVDCSIKLQKIRFVICLASSGSCPNFITDRSLREICHAQMVCRYARTRINRAYHTIRGTSLTCCFFIERLRRIWQQLGLRYRAGRGDVLLYRDTK